MQNNTQLQTLNAKEVQLVSGGNKDLYDLLAEHQKKFRDAWANEPFKTDNQNAGRG